MDLNFLYNFVFENNYNAVLSLFKAKIIEDNGPTDFKSIKDIHEVPQVKEYLLECSKEHYSDIHSTFIDIFLSIYYNTNEPINGNLLRPMISNIKHNVIHRLDTDKTPRPICSCMVCCSIYSYFKGKPDIDYFARNVLLIGNNGQSLYYTSSNIKETDVNRPGSCRYDKSHDNFNQGISFNYLMTFYRPEYIKFFIHNYETVLHECYKKDLTRLKKYVEYYHFLENCMHPDKLGTVNFITITPKLSPVEELTEKINELITKLDSYNDSDAITNARFKYLLSIINK